VAALLAAAPASASTLAPCFTPDENCAAFIVRQIDAAQTELLIQAFSFTNDTIVGAIAKARDRGVKVKIILSNRGENRRWATPLRARCMDVFIDHRRVAHNKVLVIDSKHVITGSFNLSVAAERKNAENVLLIADDPVLAAAYISNWNRRARESREFPGCATGPR
jgi:phospholipase D